MNVVRGPHRRWRPAPRARGRGRRRTVVVLHEESAPDPFLEVRQELARGAPVTGPARRDRRRARSLLPCAGWSPPRRPGHTAPRRCPDAVGEVCHAVRPGRLDCGELRQEQRCPPLRANRSSARSGPTMARAASRSSGPSSSVRVVPGSRSASSSRVLTTRAWARPTWAGACDSQRSVAGSARCASSSRRTTGWRCAARRTHAPARHGGCPVPCRARSARPAATATPPRCSCRGGIPARGHPARGRRRRRAALGRTQRGDEVQHGWRGRAWPNSSHVTEGDTDRVPPTEPLRPRSQEPVSCRCRPLPPRRRGRSGPGTTPRRSC